MFRNISCILNDSPEIVYCSMYVRRKYKKKVIDIEFNKTQIDFMKKIGISFNFSNISDEDYILIEEKVSAYLQKKGFNEDYTPNRDGEMCESILDMLDV